MRRNFLLIILLVIILHISLALAVEPFGADITPGTSQRAPPSAPGTDVNAIAGNVTELNVFGYSITQSWQGYYGNVTGTIQLADSSDNILYNWSLAYPEGEIYASNASTINWAGIQCYDESNNLTFFENMFGIEEFDVDGINETFLSNDHAEFYTNNIQFTAGLCDNTKLYNSAGVGTFDEALLTDGDDLVFASLLLDDANGFDNIPHDFEMIVLENGHGTDTDTTTYYFWVELE